MTLKSLIKDRSILKKLIAVSIYAFAMGYLESAVVMYLRQTAFGNTFQVFPIRFLEPKIGRIEFVREAATIVMLLTIGYLAGKNRFQKWMFFVYTFAMWDIVYYICLKLFTGWPASFGDFDVLFLIPVVWVSPVICPILISLLLTITSTMLILIAEERKSIRVRFFSIVTFGAGSAIVFYSFTEQIFFILIHQGQKGLGHFTPSSFDWLSFSIGFTLLCFSAIMAITDCYHKLTSQSVAQRESLLS